VIDLHTHILPEVDDGARSLADAIAIAASAADDGVRVMAATPHVRADFPTRPEDVDDGVAALNAELAAAGIDVAVVPGAEVALERLPLLTGEELRRFTLGRTGVYLLVEFPYRGWPFALARVVEELVAAGIVPVLAHPERNGVVQDDPPRLRDAVDAGAIVQLTAGSVDGSIGAAAAQAAFDLLEQELAHMLASDVHGPHLRMGRLRSAVDALGDAALAQRLTQDVPAAILAGAPLPA
jgi:protein-tyrosine phosphatase